MKHVIGLIILIAGFGFFQIGNELSLENQSQKGSDKQGFCSTDELHESLLRSDPNYAKLTQESERAAYEFFSSQKNISTDGPEKQNALYTLPVVFHIIHNNGSENISDALVLQGLLDLNEAFENINYYDQGTGVNVEIDFCLATRDPDGNATSGITRDVDPLTNLNYNIDDVNMKNINRWAPRDYINIWVVKEICNNNGCSVAGYAYLPGAHGSSVDGIVLEAKWLGSTQWNSTVLVHEMGHYLGLRHTFQGGCTNDNCLLDGDGVCDTPPDNSTAAVPCGATANSCFTDVNLADPNNPFITDQDDLYIDYMDYGSFSCYSAFTAGQRDRMHFFTTGTRASLLDSDGCDPPCLDPLTAIFTPSASNIIAGQSVNFMNTTVNGTSWDWQIDGTTFSNLTNPSYTFNSAGTFNITLFAFNSDPNCSASADTFITVICNTNAAFSASETTFQIGSTITFSDASVNVTNYNWTIDNVNFSNIPNPDYTFNTPGNFLICLEGDNGICSDISCQNIFVNSEPPDNCNNTFLKLVGDPFLFERGLSIIPSNDGNFFLTGMRADSALIMKMTPSGDFIWQRSFKFTNRPDEILDLRINSEGLLLGAGQGQLGSVNNNPFYFKYDPLADNFLWAVDIAYFNGYYSRIHEIDSAGNYLITGAINDPRDVLITSINPTTGSEQWTERYNLNGSDDSESSVFYNNQLFSTGRQSFSGNVGGMRGAVTRFNLDGTYDYNRLYLENQNQSVRMYTTDILVQNDTIVLAFFVDKAGTGPDFTPTMAKTDLDGNIIWAKDYEINEYPNVRTKAVIELPDGLLLHGTTFSPEGRVFLIKTDLNGNTQWAKAYGGMDGATNIQVDIINRTPRSPVLYFNNFIYFIGGAWNFGDFNEDQQIFIGKIHPDGTVDEANCPFIEDITINETTYINPYDGSGQLSQPAAGPMEFYRSPVSGNLDMDEEIICQELCTEIEINIAGDSLVCLSDNSLVYRLENLSDCEPTSLTWEITGGSLISFGADSVIVELPTTGQASIIAFAELNCFSISDTLDIIINDSLRLDLGGDIHVCHNATFTLNAGSGFSSYVWNDTSTDSTFAAWLSGIYWVETTDACGTVRRDSMELSIDSSLLIIDNQFSEICPGQSVTVTLSGYDDYQWFPSTGLGCDDCPSNTISPTSTIGYYVVGSTDEGCISVDTIGITIPEYFTNDSITICEGESAIIFGNPESAQGDYSEFYNTAFGCDSTHTISLIVLDTVLTSEMEIYCSNNSPYPSDTTLAMVFLGENGCDSTHLVIVDVIQAPVLSGASQAESCAGNDGSATVTILAGDTPFQYFWDVNTGSQTTETATGLSLGIYSVTVSGSNGCIEFLTVFVNDGCNCNLSLTLSGSSQLTCFGDQNGQINTQISGGTGTYTYTWSANAGGQTNAGVTGLSAGSYSLTVNDGPFCLTSSVFSISQPPLLMPDIMGFNSQCGNSHASAVGFVSGGVQPYTYLWSTGATSTSINNLATGNYSLTITDGNGCQEIDTEFLTSEELGPVLMSTFLNSTCAGANDGSIDLMVIGGTGPFSYMWNDGITAEDRQGLSPGEYTVFVTDANGCLAVTTIVIAESGELNLDLSSTPSNGSDGTAMVTVLGGVTPFTYQWNTGATGPSINGLAPAVYTVFVTDGNGCTGSGSVEVPLFVSTYKLTGLEYFEIMPNPSNGRFSVDIRFEQVKDFSLEVYNTPGQLLYKSEHRAIRVFTPIQIDHLAAGMYYLTLRTSDGLAAKPLVILPQD